MNINARNSEISFTILVASLICYSVELSIYRNFFNIQKLYGIKFILL